LPKEEYEAMQELRAISPIPLFADESLPYGKMKVKKMCTELSWH